MKICMISKYPPIGGGVSSKTYWTAKALGEQGHEVQIVTNALEVEEEYREEFDLSDPNYQPKNVFVNSTDPAPTIEANPSHIPFSKMYCEKLASNAIEVISDNDMQLIDSRYLVPYGVAGYLAKSLTGIPLVVSHAGSDLQRLYPSLYLKKLLEKILLTADKVITNPESAALIYNLGVLTSRVSVLPQVYVDTNSFSPNAATFDFKDCLGGQKFYPRIPVVGFFGKVAYHYETKGLPELLAACNKIKEDFLLLFVANGNKIEEFKAEVKKAGLNRKALFLPFQPPWKMPSILKACTCIVSLENFSSPVIGYHVPTVPAEAMATGACVVMSKEIHAKEPYSKLKDGRDLLVVDAKDTGNIKKSLEGLISKPELAEEIGANSHRAIVPLCSIEGYVDELLRIYETVLSRKS